MVGALFIALTALLTFPQIVQLRSLPAHHDPFFSVWRLAWFAHAMSGTSSRLLDANIFSGERHNFLFSDAVLLDGVIATPAIWLGLDPVVAYNIEVLLSFVACGLACCLLVKSLTDSTPAGVIAGIIYAFLPFRFGNYVHLEILGAWPIPLTFWAIHRLMAQPRGIPRAALVAACLSAQVFSSLYLAVFLATAVGVFIPFALSTDKGSAGQQLRGLALAAGLCAVITLPYFLLYSSAASAVGTRSAYELTEWSPGWQYFTHAGHTNWLYGRTTASDSLELQLFPGITAICLAAIGLSSSVQSVRTRLAYLTVLLVALDMSRGTHGWLYPMAFNYLAPYRGLRVPARMFAIVSLALAVLAGLGFRRLSQVPLFMRYRSVGQCLLAAALVTEYWSAPLPLTRVPEPPGTVYAWLREQPNATVLEWPFRRFENVEDTHDPLYMYYSLRHWHVLANGYSGFFPLSYNTLMEDLYGFPTQTGVESLRARHIELLILHGDIAPGEYQHVRDYLANYSENVTLVFGETTDQGETTVFRLAPL